MNWVLVFITFIGPLYDSEGFIKDIEADISLRHNSEIVCTYTSRIINGKLKASRNFENNGITLEKKITICLTGRQLDYFKKTSNDKLFNRVEINNIIKNF